MKNLTVMQSHGSVLSWGQNSLSFLQSPNKSEWAGARAVGADLTAFAQV